MDAALFISLISIIIFGILAIFFAIREEKLRKELKEREEKQKQRLYEISILREIQDRIGYELDLEKIVDVVTGSLHNLFPYSCVSALISKETTLIFKTTIKEQVNRTFVDTIRQNMLASLKAMNDQQFPQEITEIITGPPFDETNTAGVGSFFHIPLVVNNVVLGVISIASTKQGLYREDEMTILYKIVDQAARALSRLENVLETEKGKLLAMIGSLADGVFMVDTQSQLLVINDAAKTLLGITKEKPTMLDVIAAFPQTQDISAHITQAITRSSPVAETILKLGDKTVQLFITPVYGIPHISLEKLQEKQVIGASVLLHDITVEKSLSQMKDDFTNMVVHELRAPLTAIRGASQMILTKETMDHEQKKKLITIIHEQTQRLLNEVSSLLDAAKMDAGKFVVHKEPIDIVEVVKEKKDVFTAPAATKNITLALDLDENLPKIAADRYRVGQVLNNILSNSIKYTPDNGSITISVKRQESSILMSIKDTGVGIPYEKQHSLFSKFYQVTPASYSEHNISTGLGLYIAKGIIEAHGGTISLTSAPGMGTVVSFTLPVTDMPTLDHTHRVTLTPTAYTE